MTRLPAVVRALLHLAAVPFKALAERVDTRLADALNDEDAT